MFYVPGEEKGMPARTTSKKKTTGARIRSWFRSIDAHDEQERIKLRWDGHNKEVQRPYRSVVC